MDIFWNLHHTAPFEVADSFQTRGQEFLHQYSYNELRQIDAKTLVYEFLKQNIDSVDDVTVTKMIQFVELTFPDEDHHLPVISASEFQARKLALLKFAYRDPPLLQMDQNDDDDDENFEPPVTPVDGADISILHDPFEGVDTPTILLDKSCL